MEDEWTLQSSGLKRWVMKHLTGINLALFLIGTMGIIWLLILGVDG